MYKFIITLWLLTVAFPGCEQDEDIFNWYVDVSNQTGAQVVIEYTEHSENWHDSHRSDTLRAGQMKSIYVKFFENYADIDAKLGKKKTNYLVPFEAPSLSIYADDF